MLQLLTLNQVEIVREKFATLSSKTCDYTVGGRFMWRDFYKMEYHVDKDDIFIRQIDNFGNIFYALPMSNDIVGRGCYSYYGYRNKKASFV